VVHELPSMCRRFVDEALTVPIGLLRLRPWSADQGTLILDDPVPGAVSFRWSTAGLSGEVHLSTGRSNANFRLVGRRCPGLGREVMHWSFICPTSGRKLQNVYCLQEVWGTRISLGLTWRSHIGKRKRLEWARTRTVKKLMDLEARRPFHEREQRLQGKLESIRRELETMTR
jgi:hypothetical protein